MNKNILIKFNHGISNYAIVTPAISANGRKRITIPSSLLKNMKKGTVDVKLDTNSEIILTKLSVNDARLSVSEYNANLYLVQSDDKSVTVKPI